MGFRVVDPLSLCMLSALWSVADKSIPKDYGSLIVVILASLLIALFKVKQVHFSPFCVPLGLWIAWVDVDLLCVPSSRLCATPFLGQKEEG